MRRITQVDVFTHELTFGNPVAVRLTTTSGSAATQ
jgi:predicted PhzF superfamily epimerase YddE/YHI9